MTRLGPKDKTAAPAVSVLIVTYNCGPTLNACLEALRGQTMTDFEVILSDNAPDDPAPRDAAASDPSLRLLENGANLGFAAGVNRAAEIARGRWLALLNPDAYAAPDWLEQLLHAAGANPQVRCFTSRQLMADDPTVLDGLGDVMSAAGFPFRGGYGLPDPGRHEIGEVFSACGGAMLIDRALYAQMGGLDERLFCYCEDVDLGYRLRLAGEPTLVVPDAVVRHEGSASSGGPRSDFAVFHGTRNRLWVYVKDTPPVLLAVTLPIHIAATLYLLARKWMNGEVSALRGFAAGVKGLPIALAARREAQAQRKVGSWAIARALTWNPADLHGRRVVIRPWRPSRSTGS